MHGDSNLITKKVKRYSSISLVEGLLIAIGLIIIAVIVAVYFNPFGMTAQSRNDQREADIEAISGALVSYSQDNQGTLPEGIPVSNQCSSEGNRICATGKDCSGLVDLSALTRESKYMEKLPMDPKVEGENVTGYNIVQNESGRVTLCAPLAEEDKEITTTL